MNRDKLLKLLAEAGRGNDTALAHITPEQAKLLKARGGSGKINPATGLREFDDFGDFGGYDYGSYDYGGGYSYDPGPSYDPYVPPSYDYSTPTYDPGYYNPPSYMPDYTPDYLSTPTYDTPTYDTYTPTYDPYVPPSYDPYIAPDPYVPPSYDTTPTYDPYVPPSYDTGPDYSSSTGALDATIGGGTPALDTGAITPIDTVQEAVAPALDFSNLSEYTSPTYENPVDTLSFAAPAFDPISFQSPYISTPTFEGVQFFNPATVSDPSAGLSLDSSVPTAEVPGVQLMNAESDTMSNSDTLDPTQNQDGSLLSDSNTLARDLLQGDIYNPYAEAIDPATQLMPLENAQPTEPTDEADLPSPNAVDAASRVLPSNIDFTTVRDPITSITDKSREMAIRTIAAESGNNDKEALGIANVIRNRLENGQWGNTIDSVVTAPKQFSPWGLPTNNQNYPMNISTSDPRYVRAEQAYDQAFNKGVNNVGNVVGFYAPGLIGEPSWARQGAAYDIGNTRFVSTPGTSFLPPSGNIANVAPAVPLPPERPAIFAETMPPIPQPPQREPTITAFSGQTFPPNQTYEIPSQFAGTAPSFLPNLSPTDQQTLEAFTRSSLPVLPGGTPEPAPTGIAALPQAPAPTVEPAQPTGPTPGSWEALAQLARQGYNYVTGATEPTGVTLGPPSGSVVDARNLIAASSSTPAQANVTANVVEDLVASAPIVTPQQRAEEEILNQGVPEETRTADARGDVPMPQGVPDIMSSEPGSDFPVQTASATEPSSGDSASTEEKGPIDRVSDWISGTAKDAVNNPIKTATNIGVGMIPGVGLVNTLSGLLGGPTAGGILNDMVKGGSSGGGGGGGGGAGYVVAGNPVNLSISAGFGGGGGGYSAPSAPEGSPSVPAFVTPVNIRGNTFIPQQGMPTTTAYTQAAPVDLSGVRSLPQSFVQTYNQMSALPQYAYADYSNFGPRQLAHGGIVSLRGEL